MERFPYMDNLKKQITNSLRKQKTLIKVKSTASSTLLTHPNTVILSHRTHLEIIATAKKYILPEDGLLIPDPLYQYIVGKDLVLPFPTISMEFQASNGDYFIIFAQERMVPMPHTHEKEKLIILSCWIGDRLTAKLRWTSIPPVMFSPVNAFELNSSGKIMFREWYINELTGPDVNKIHEIQFIAGKQLLHFLNSMACRVAQDKSIQIREQPIHNPQTKLNVRKELVGNYQYITIVVPKVIKPESETKTTLEVGERFRPREHSRAGHYRYYKDGHRTWIPANLINKGVGKAVEKKYVVKPARNLNQERSMSHEKRPNV